jgi:hypothetical protein
VSGALLAGGGADALRRLGVRRGLIGGSGGGIPGSKFAIAILIHESLDLTLGDKV